MTMKYLGETIALILMVIIIVLALDPSALGKTARAVVDAYQGGE
ncbi:hypothetical protein [Oceaniglobus trochenteri]|nr:hypothetical protein [Oceaniglobus trochenteri]